MGYAPWNVKKKTKKQKNKQNKTMVMSLYFSHILKSVNHEWFIYFYRTDLECFQIFFDFKKQTRCHLLVNVRRFIETVQYCPLLGSFPCLWQLKIVYINFCCDISQNILTLQKKHLFSIFVFVFNWMFVWFLYFLFK